MSQKIIFQILQDLGGEANVSEIKSTAREEFPDRTLDEYTYRRLKSLEKRDLISKKSEGDIDTWTITDDSADLASTTIEEIDNQVGKNKLAKLNLEVSNIVVTFDFDIEVDLHHVHKNLTDTMLEPEMMTPLVHQQNSRSNATFLLYSSGRVIVLGVDNKADIKSDLSRLIKDLRASNYDPKASIGNAVVRNIHTVGDLETEIDLNELSIYLGLEDVEYNPAEFPGLIYRLIGDTVTLYRTGKFSVIGSESYLDVLNTVEKLFERIPPHLVKSLETYSMRESKRH